MEVDMSEKLTPESVASQVEYLSRRNMIHELLGFVGEYGASEYARGMEAAAKIAEDGRFLHDDAPDARFGKAVAAAIRRAAKEKA